MQLFAIGINHRTAPVALRERIAFPPEQIKSALQMLRAAWNTHPLLGQSATPLPEVAILSTCNRTEIYGACSAGGDDHAGHPPTPVEASCIQCVAHWLSAYHHIPLSELMPHLYTHPHSNAVRHAFRVASGLDSMVLGETQILGQFKIAARAASEAGALGAYLNRLFQHSFSVAKEVRGQTQISAYSVSIASAAVRLAQRIFEQLSEQRVLLIGAGAVIEVCAMHFAAQHPRALVIANRTVGRGSRLAERVNGTAIELAELPVLLHEFDIVVSCTASTLPIIGLGAVERALRARKRRPIFMVDLAVPRDIEAEVAQLQDIFLYTLDDLGAIVQKGHAQRQAAAIQAEAIIESRVGHFMHWFNARCGVPVIRKLHSDAHRLRRAALVRAQRRLTHGEDPYTVLESFSHALTKALLHAPTRAFNQARRDERTLLVQLLGLSSEDFSVRLPKSTPEYSKPPHRGGSTIEDF